MTRLSLLIALVLMALPLFAQNPAARAARCPECFPGGPVFTPYPTQIRPPAYYGGYYGGGFAPVFFGGYGYRAAGVWTGVAATAAGAGIAIAVDEIQQRRAEAAENRRDRRDQARQQSPQQQGVVQLRNCRVYEASEKKDAPPLMVCEDPNGTKIVMEREK